MPATNFAEPLPSGNSLPRVFFLDSAPFCGGAQESLLSLLSSLFADGWSVQLATADRSEGGLARRAVSLGLPVIDFSARHWPASLSGLAQAVGDCRRAAPLLRRQLAQFQPDVVHLNGLRAAVVYASLGAHAARMFPVVLHDRDLRAPFGLRPYLARRLSPQVVAISSAVANRWQRVLPVSQLHLVPNGLPIAAIHDLVATMPPLATPLAQQGEVVALVADFVAWKGHQLFLEALALARREHPWRAVLRGRTRDQAGERLLGQLQSLAQTLGLADDALTFVTEPGSALPSLAAADLVCACAEQEPFGRTLVEALAMGKPLAVTTTAGAPEIIRDCPAITVAKATPQDLAKAMNGWKEREQRLQVADSARRRAAQFDLPEHVAAIKNVYNIALTGK